MSGRPWTDGESTFVRDFHGTLPAWLIGWAIDRSARAVYLHALTLGIAKKANRLTSARQRQLARLARAGACNRCIGRAINLGREAVRKWRRRLGLPDIASGGSVATCRTCVERTRQTTQRQCRRAGVRNLAEVEALTVARRALAAGWPAECAPREVQILDALYERGPLTRKEIAAAIGMPWKGSRKSLTGNVPGGSYLAHLMRLGLVVIVGRKAYPWADGRGRRETLYAVPLYITKGVSDG